MAVDQLLSPAVRLALAWQPQATRPALEALFALDGRLGKVVARAREPMLAQIRFAWWRERLAEIGCGPTPSEPLLDALEATWGSAAGELTPLVDGWEALIDGAAGWDALAAARGQSWAAFAVLAGAPDEAEAAAEAGRRWASSEAEPREFRERLKPLTLTPQLRGLAVLGWLATRALERGEPLGSGRGAILAAWRVGLLGRLPSMPRTSEKGARMSRLVLGGLLALAFVGLGLFWWQGPAAVEAGAPPPVPSPAALAPDVLPTAEVAGMRGPAPPQASELTREEQRFFRYDRNRDRRITRNEMLSTRTQAFRKLDKDGNNLLDFEEWAIATARRFDGADANRDRELNLDEFIKGNPAPARRKQNCRC